MISVLSQRPPPGKYDADQFESQWILSYFADYLVPVLVQPEPGHAGGEQTQHSHGRAAKLWGDKIVNLMDIDIGRNSPLDCQYVAL